MTSLQVSKRKREKIFYLTTKQYKNKTKKETDAQSSENKCTAKNRENFLVSDLWHLEEIDLSCFRTILVLPHFDARGCLFLFIFVCFPCYINNQLQEFIEVFSNSQLGAILFLFLREVLN